MAEELDPCLHLIVRRENAGWFCQGCREQFAPAADIRRVDDINARFAVKEWARRVVPMREVENAQRAVPRMDGKSTGESTVCQDSKPRIVMIPTVDEKVASVDEASVNDAYAQLHPMSHMNRSQDDRPITPEMVKISDLESRLRWLEADKIAPLEKNIANHKDIIREMRERERSVLAALAEHFGKITSLETTVSDQDRSIVAALKSQQYLADRMKQIDKTVSDLDERRAILEKIVGRGDTEMSHSRMISNLTQAVMRLENQAGI